MPTVNNNKNIILYGGIGLALLVVIIIACMMMKKERFNSWVAPTAGSYTPSSGVMGSAPYVQGGSLMLESDANGNLSTSATLPVGAIIIWYGKLNSIPLGWVLCDGNNGTPNLSNNNFPMGASSDAGIGQIGGNASYPLPSHSHNVYTTSGAGGGQNVQNLVNGIINAPSVVPLSNDSSSNTPFYGAPVNVSPSGGAPPGQDIVTMPPYVGVYYIMKIQ